MEAEYQTVTVGDIPTRDLKLLAPLAKAAGFSDQSMSAVVKYGFIQWAGMIRDRDRADAAIAIADVSDASGRRG